MIYTFIIGNQGFTTGTLSKSEGDFDQAKMLSNIINYNVIMGRLHMPWLTYVWLNLVIKRVAHAYSKLRDTNIYLPVVTFVYNIYFTVDPVVNQKLHINIVRACVCVLAINYPAMKKLIFNIEQ